MGQQAPGLVRGLQQIAKSHFEYGQQHRGSGLPPKRPDFQHMGRQSLGPVVPKSQSHFKNTQEQAQHGLGPSQSNSKPILQQNKSWANITDARAHRPPTRLEFFPPSGTQSEIPLIKLPSDVIDECTEYWMNTLVGYFIEKRVPFLVV